MRVNIFKGHDVEISPGRKVHVGSKAQEGELKTRFGIARYEEIKERAKQPPSSRRHYELSEKTKRLHSHIRSKGVTWRFVEQHMPGWLRPKGGSGWPVG